MQRFIRAVRKFFSFGEAEIDGSLAINDSCVAYEVVEIDSPEQQRRDMRSSVDETLSETVSTANHSRRNEADRPHLLLGASRAPFQSVLQEEPPRRVEFRAIKVVASSPLTNSQQVFAYLTGTLHSQPKRPHSGTDNLVLVQGSGRFMPLVTEELVQQMRHLSPESLSSASLASSEVGSFIDTVEDLFVQAKSRVIHNVLHIREVPCLPLLHKIFLQLTPSSAYTLVLIHSLENKLKRGLASADLGVGGRSYLEEILDLLSVVHSTTMESSSMPRVVLALDCHRHFRELCFGLSELEEVARGTFLKVLWEEMISALGNMPNTSDNLDIREAAVDTGQDDFKRLKKGVMSKAAHAKLPLRWTYLIVFVKSYSAAHDLPVLTYSTFLNFAQAFSLSDKESLQALQVYQDLGLLYRLPTRSSLQRYVFVDLGWFFKSFSALGSKRESLLESLMQDWEVARRSGKISQALYQHIVDSTPVPCGLPKNWIFNLLQQWHLLHESSKHGRFSPLFLSPTLKKDARETCERRSASAFYQFPTGSIPPGYLSLLATVLRRKPGFSPLVSTSSSSCSFQLAPPHHPVSYHVKMSLWRGNLRIHLCGLGQRSISSTQLSDACSYLMEMVTAACRQVHATWPHLERSGNCRQVLHLYLTCPCARFSPTSRQGNKHLALVVTKMDAESVVQCTVTRHQYKLRTLPVSQRVWTHLTIEGMESSSAPDRLSKILATSEDDYYDSDSDSDETDHSPALLHSLCSMSRSLMSTTMEDPTVSVLNDLERDLHKKLDLESSVCRSLQDYGVLDREQFTQVRVGAIAPRGWTRATASRAEARRDAVRLLVQRVRQQGPRGYMALVAALTHHIEDTRAIANFSASIDQGLFTRTYNHNHEDLLHLLTVNRFFAVIRAIWLESVIA